MEYTHNRKLIIFLLFTTPPVNLYSLADNRVIASLTAPRLQTFRQNENKKASHLCTFDFVRILLHRQSAPNDYPLERPQSCVSILIRGRSYSSVGE